MPSDTERITYEVMDRYADGKRLPDFGPLGAEELEDSSELESNQSFSDDGAKKAGQDGI